MSFTTWLQNLRTLNAPGRVQRNRRQTRVLGAASRYKPRFETLEDRMCLSSLPFIAPPTPSDVILEARASAAYGQLPLSFEANQGQMDDQVNFVSRGSGHTLFLTPSEAVIALQGLGKDTVVRMQLVGANAAAQAVGLDQQANTSNYLVGNDPSQWHTGIANYGRVEYRSVYAGIDVAYYGIQRQLEYDFIVAPGADTKSIRLSFEGANGLSLDSQGNLLVHTAAGDLVENAPVLYQESHGVRQAVAGRYVLEENRQVSFDVGAYDATRPLVIDPVFSLSYSTFLGGSGTDRAYSIAVDGAGNAYVTGLTNSTNFPTKNPVQAGNRGYDDVFVAKLNPAGSALVYSTYLGGQGNDVGKSLALFTDEAGKTFAYVAGFTESTNFPTMSPRQGSHGGGTWDAFVAKLNDTGSGLVYSTYLGGSGQDKVQGLAVDAAGNAYVTGHTASTNFPTVNSLFPYKNGGFVAELNAAGSALVYSTYLGGGSSTAIAVDSSGNAYVTGSTSSTSFPSTAGAFQTTPAGQGDAFVMKLLPGGSGLAYSTFLGGNATDVANGIAVDSSGNAYVTGFTTSTNWPTTSGAFQTLHRGGADVYGGADAFVTRLNATGSELLYSTYLGGTGSDYGFGIAVGSDGNAYVTGETRSANFPVANALQPTFNGGISNGGADAFVTQLNATGSGLVYSTFLGGSYAAGDSGSGIAVDSTGNAYVTGSTTSTDFPTKYALQGTYGGGAHASDAFVTKIAPPAMATGPSLLITGMPSMTTAGAAGGFTIIARDIDGNTLIGYAGTVHFSSSDSQAALPADYTFTAADQGMHTFSAIFKTAGLQSLTAAAPGMSGDPVSILVNASAATRFVVSGPSTAKAGKAFSITVTVLDAYGNFATGYTGTISLTSSDSTAVLPALYTFTAADNGVHTFTGLKLRKKGIQTITLTETLSSSITGSLAISVS
jgi:hypothetical protein